MLSINKVFSQESEKKKSFDCTAARTTENEIPAARLGGRQAGSSERQRIRFRTTALHSRVSTLLHNYGIKLVTTTITSSLCLAADPS
jgi:hypothetical protein